MTRSFDADPRWKLTEHALGKLLARLDSDQTLAAEQYEKFRRRLNALFHAWGCDNGWELADRTLDRVAVKLEEGAVVPEESLFAYTRGVARMVFYESARDRERERSAAMMPAQASALDDSEEEAMASLDECLDELPRGDRRLILEYYGAASGSAEVRRRMAMKLTLSPTALRIRAHRLRQRIEQCLAAAMGWKQP